MAYLFKFRKFLWLELALDSRCFCDPSAACLLKEKNSLTLKNSFSFLTQGRAGCVPAKQLNIPLLVHKA